MFCLTARFSLIFWKFAKTILRFEYEHKTQHFSTPNLDFQQRNDFFAVDFNSIALKFIYFKTDEDADINQMVMYTI